MTSRHGIRKAFDNDLWQGISEEQKQKAFILKQEVLDKSLFKTKTRGGLVIVNFGEDPKSNPEYFETQTAKLRTGKSSPMAHLVADWESTEIDTHKHSVNTIKWFCSVPYTNPENEEERKIQEYPRGMMCSLLNQLLRVISDEFPEFNLSGSFLDDKDFADRLKNREIKALWGVFSCLVVQLPWGADVMCVIDKITTYETSDLEEDLDFIIVSKGGK
ncbi:hypothetical protein BDP55DRAFT_758966 [Colletotrichum godetiae]|uniref:Uncharacterized protein n=1 Tax=Colletotrichum godetiae TaxID=1209918 RepID=A0AAJ0EP84_9PEZI|nr:uncharacterized protein BDP55DRAFT_758966 [Colletotrichum godetiae]KAK1658322.1 hypothetical protein BDP55DRAFT_758966 [Colletotrichum godetiae]